MANLQRLLKDNHPQFRTIKSALKSVKLRRILLYKYFTTTYLYFNFVLLRKINAVISTFFKVGNRLSKSSLHLIQLHCNAPYIFLNALVWKNKLYLKSKIFSKLD